MWCDVPQRTLHKAITGTGTGTGTGTDTCSVATTRTLVTIPAGPLAVAWWCQLDDCDAL